LEVNSNINMIMSQRLTLKLNENLFMVDKKNSLFIRMRIKNFRIRVKWVARLVGR